MKKSIILMPAILLIVAVMAVLFSIKKTSENQEEPVVYGDIDFDAETVAPKKPASNMQGCTVGNTYLNLLNKGLFCETDDYYFFVVKYDLKDYLIRMDKDTEDTVKIFQGDIRNIFVFDGWVYGILNEGLSEYMIAMDVDGNNQYISSKYINNVRTMQSDGNKVYFTVDQRNVTGMTLCTSICQCDMDLSHEEAVKTVDNELSQVDIISIKDGVIYFNETMGSAKEVQPFVPVPALVDEYPVIHDGEVTVFDSSVCSKIIGNKCDFICVNTHGPCAYLSAVYGDKNYLITYNMDTKENSFEEYENRIDQIYEYTDGIVLYSNGKYERIKK